MHADWWPGRAPTGAGSRFLSATLEKRLQNFPALIRQHTTVDFEAMIERGAVRKVDGAPRSPGFRVIGAEYQAFDSRLHQRAQAHWTGFERDVDGGARQARISSLCRRRPDRH